MAVVHTLNTNNKTCYNGVEVGDFIYIGSHDSLNKYSVKDKYKIISNLLALNLFSQYKNIKNDIYKTILIILPGYLHIHRRRFCTNLHR